MKKIVLGILAHVDAGKTTLSEGMLFHSGIIKKLGRVDHQDTFLDTDEMEKRRGITIFSKQAELEYKDLNITLLDTPGHVDFSAEMERTLAVLDYGILVVNGMDGVQSHTETLWQLLKRYKVPTFIFVNKMDMSVIKKEKLMDDLRHRFGESCVYFEYEKDSLLLSENTYENIALLQEDILDYFLKKGRVEDEKIKRLISKRKLVPVLFGSALKQIGVKELMEIMDRFILEKEENHKFGARVFKISRDNQGNRLSHIKITGGFLKCKEDLQGEKVNQIRIYSGEKYQCVDQVCAGQVCAVTGPTKTYAGQGLGFEEDNVVPSLVPVLNYKLEFKQTELLKNVFQGSSVEKQVDAFTVLKDIKQLEEEDPLLHVLWNEKLKEIHIQVMGQVQIEILKNIILNRFGYEVDFVSGRVAYKETIGATSFGVGHFEPLRHYSEVVLMLEPLERDSGLQFESDCSEDDLDKNWQRLILTHLEEKEHLGVLTGSPITDMKITLIGGRAHTKHTEGGDFRQATYRAVRQGLMMGENILLEPIYSFYMELPETVLGRAMSDITRLYGEFDTPDLSNGMAILKGKIPVSTMQGYHRDFISYTHGKGRLTCSLKGYEPCHNPEEVKSEINYNPEEDLENTAASVFCSHGAGVIVPWYMVYEYMHVKNVLEIDCDKPEEAEETLVRHSGNSSDMTISEDELTEIFNRTYGTKEDKITTRKKWAPRRAAQNNGNLTASRADMGLGKSGAFKKNEGKDFLLVDGYNIIFAWPELKELATVNLDSARSKLMDIMANYQGFCGCELILVFDAYKVKGNLGEIMEYGGIHVVYTKEAETADMYIEKTTHELGRKHKVTVATSDGLEQVIILGQGALRMSALGFLEEVERVNELMRKNYLK